MNKNDENWFNSVESDRDEKSQDNNSENPNEYAPKRQARPRFSRPAGTDDNSGRFKRVELNRHEESDSDNRNFHPYDSNRPQRPYDSDRSQRPYDSNRPQRPYDPDRSQRPYDPNRPQRPYDPDRSQRPYDSNRPQRPYDPNRSQRPYDPNRSQRPYDPNRSQRPYDPNRSQRPYDPNRPQRPYDPNRSQHPYDPDRSQRPYDPNRSQRPYDPNRSQRPYDPNRPQRPYDPNRSQRPYDPNRSGRYGSGPYNPNDKYSKKKQIEYKEVLADPNEPIRLNKFLANSGICSRREADVFITTGVVSVNGEVVTELGTKVKRSDTVKFHDQTISPERKIYILLNKPKDCVTTVDDPQERKTVMDYVKDAGKERIYPVGRLDRNTTGVLLLTNDGELASKLTHPKFLKKKIYQVHCDKNVTKNDMDQLVQGIELEDGEIHADEVSYISDTDRSQVGIEIHSGRNRIVRRMFESLGYKVTKLDRVLFAGLTKKNLRRGDWRYLTEKEVDMLRMGAFE